MSGIRPGGRLHLGNYFGSICDCLSFQYEYVGGAFYFIADLHEMTYVPRGSSLRRKTIDAAMDYLALGLQPDMVNFYVQSDVPQVSELMWILACVTPAEWLADLQVSADASQWRGSVSAAAVLYPELMAADCLALRASDVPIGADQLANALLIADIAKRWNRAFVSELFPVPEPKLSKFASLPGLDGGRMSKSSDNSIPIFADEQELRERILATDAPSTSSPHETRYADPALTLLGVVTDEGPDFQELAAGDGSDAADRIHLRELLLSAVVARFADARERRIEWSRHPHDVEDLLLDGGERARMEASETLELVRETVGIGSGVGTDY